MAARSVCSASQASAVSGMSPLLVVLDVEAEFLLIPDTQDATVESMSVNSRFSSSARLKPVVTATTRNASVQKEFTRQVPGRRCRVARLALKRGEFVGREEALSGFAVIGKVFHLGRVGFIGRGHRLAVHGCGSTSDQDFPVVHIAGCCALDWTEVVEAAFATPSASRSLLVHGLRRVVEDILGDRRAKLSRHRLSPIESECPQRCGRSSLPPVPTKSS